MLKEFWLGISLPLKGSSGAGRRRWLTWPTGSAMIVAAPKIWPRRPFCVLTAGSPRGLKKRSFPPGHSPLATNLYRAELRRIPARTVSLEDIAEPPDTRPADRGQEDTAYDRDLAVRRAVFALPAKYREALTLFYFHDMDVATASRSLGLPEGTVKARLFRGREILRSKLPQLLAVPHLKEA